MKRKMEIDINQRERYLLETKTLKDKTSPLSETPDSSNLEWEATNLASEVASGLYAPHPNASLLPKVSECNKNIFNSPYLTGDQSLTDNLNTFELFKLDCQTIIASRPFRRLSDKTQVFLYRNDHQRTRLTHSLEVAQISETIASALNLNPYLARAIGLSHDCGHGPGGHASEEAFSLFLDTKFDHASWGAEVVAKKLNLTEATLDGIKNHSWSRPGPKTLEGEIVALADRIAYLCGDLEDALELQIIQPSKIPLTIKSNLGTSYQQQIFSLIDEVVISSKKADRIGFSKQAAELLAEFRAFNTLEIYRSELAKKGYVFVKETLLSLSNYYSTRFNSLPIVIDEEFEESFAFSLGVPSHKLRIVNYLANMTDGYMMDLAKSYLD